MKKAQHEIAGFALIVVIVSVIGMIFLGLMFAKGDPVRRNDAETMDFLQSSMHHTTLCAKSYVPNYYNVQDLIKACYKGQDCHDLRSACKVLNETYKEIIKHSFNVNEQGSVKAYELDIYYKDTNDEIPREEILFINEGRFSNCSSEIGASQAIFSNSGNIKLDLTLCM